MHVNVVYLIAGKLLPLPGPIILGSDPDCPPMFDYKGLMDSVSNSCQIRLPFQLSVYMAVKTYIRFLLKLVQLCAVRKSRCVLCCGNILIYCIATRACSNVGRGKSHDVNSNKDYRQKQTY